MHFHGKKLPPRQEFLTRVVYHPGGNFHSYIVQYCGQAGRNFSSFPLPYWQPGRNLLHKTIPSRMPTGKEWFYVVNTFPHAKISVKMNDDHFDENFGMREGI